jgi:hypothetical protein
MAWPLSQDFNEAIQNPPSAFADADLRGGTVTTTPLGVPLPRSGNYADVYQVTGKDGRAWAVKCFTRPVAADLNARYAAIAKHLAEANLPFTVGFEFLADGIRVKGKAYPAVKMQWVEGLAINTFVQDNLNKATLLEAMLSLWVRLCRRLRETGMAHADLQHGNVILVPADGGKLGLKLVDYDGMFVPALAGKPTGEGGHASFQHPERIATNHYSADLDRFPHLVVATALRGLLVGGKPLWDQFDTGDNLLFGAKDFAAPTQSKVMRKLWDTGDPFTVGLLSHLAIACSRPLAQTPWLDQLMPEGRPPMLTPSQERQAMQVLGLPVQGAVPAAPPPSAPVNAWATPAQMARTTTAPALPALPAADDLDFSEAGYRKAKSGGVGLYGAIAAGILAAIGIGVGIVAFGGKKGASSDSIAQVGSASSSPPASSTPPIKPIDPPSDSSPKPAPPSDPNPKPISVEPSDPKPNPNPKPAPPSDPNPIAKPRMIEGRPIFNVTAAFAANPIFTADGRSLLVPLKSGVIRAFDAHTGAMISDFREMTAPKTARVVGQPAGVALTVDHQGTFIPFTVATGKIAGKILTKPPADELTNLQSDASGRFVLAVTAKTLEVIDLDESKAALTSEPGPAFISADGKQVLIATAAGELNRLTVGAAKGTTLTPADGVKAKELLAWSPAKSFAAVRDTSGDVVVLNLTNGAILKRFDDPSGICAVTPDGDHFAIAINQEIEIYSTSDWGKLGEMAASGARTAAHLAFDAAGSTLVLCHGTTVAVYSIPGLKSGRVAVTPKPTDPTMPKPVDPSMPKPTDPISPKPIDPTVAPIATARLPIPNDADLKKAEATTKEIFKDLYSKKLAADRRRLAETLLQTALETKSDATAKYWMLRETQTLAVELFDSALGAKAIDALDLEYEVDGIGLRIALLERIGAVTAKTADLKLLAESCADMVEELAEKGEFDKAVKLAGVAIAVLTKANLQASPAGRDLEARQTQLRKQKEAFEPVRTALETLKTKSDDAAAHLIVGKYRCFIQNRWTEGLPNLAAGTDAALKAAAILDLSEDAESLPLKKADAWWAYAQTLPEADRGPTVSRAKYWYSKALAAGLTGLEKAAAESRLALVVSNVEYRSGLILDILPGGVKTLTKKNIIKLTNSLELTANDYRTLPGNGIRVKLSGVIVPPSAGRYKFTVDGRAIVTLKLFSKPDERLLINIQNPDQNGLKRDVYVTLPAKPVPITIEAIMYTSGTGAFPANSVSVKWLRPGSKTDEAIPADVLYHKKADESTLTEK